MPGDDEVPEIFQRVIKAFQKHEQLSKENTRLEIAESLKEFKHFKALARQDNCMDYFYAAIPFLKYQRIRKRDYVFHHSDRGGVFYFILKGRAGVLVPKSPDAIAKEIELNATVINCGIQIAETVIPEEKAMLEADRAIALKQLTAMRDPYSEDLMSKQKIRYFKDDGRVCLFKQVNTLRSTDSFGEVSIVSNKKLRTASVIAEDEELHLLSMTGDNYVTVFDQELSRLNFTLHVLEETFTKASRDSIVRLAYEFKEVVLDKNQIIFKEGQPAKQVFLVKSGEIEITKDIKKLQVASFFNPRGNAQTIVKETPCNFIRKFELKSQTIAILGAEAFFGLEEKQFHQFSARSSSNNSIVFSIDRQLLEDYNVWKLLQKRSALKNQFYSERFYKIKELEEQQDVQRAQPRRPDFQMLMKAGERVSLEGNKKEQFLGNNSQMKSKARSNSTIHDGRVQQLISSKGVQIYSNNTSKSIKETEEETPVRQAQQNQINNKLETKQEYRNMNQSMENNNNNNNNHDQIQSDFYAQITEKNYESEHLNNIFQTQQQHSSELGLTSLETLRLDQPGVQQIGKKEQEGEAGADHNNQQSLPLVSVEIAGDQEKQAQTISEKKSIEDKLQDQHDLLSQQIQKEQISQTSQAEQQVIQHLLNSQNYTQLNTSQNHPKLKIHWSSILSSTTNNSSRRHHKTTSLCLNTVFRNAPETINAINITKGQHSLHINEPAEDRNHHRHETEHASSHREHTNDTRPRIVSWNEMSSIEQQNVRYANEKTAQNVSSLHSFSTNNIHSNNNNHIPYNGSNILIGSNIEDPNIYGLNPRQLLHFGEEKSHLQPQPKLQFRLVIQDILEQRDIAETLNYFKKNRESKVGASWQSGNKRSISNYKSPDTIRRSLKDQNHCNTIQKKTEGFEGQIETQSIKEKIGQTLTYNQTVLDQKKHEQLSRLQETLELEKLEYLKMQKHAVIRNSKRKQDDFLQGVVGGSEQACNQVILKLNQGQEDPLSSLICLPKQFQQQEEYEGNTASSLHLHQTQSQALTPHESNLHLSIKSLPPLFKTTANLKISSNSNKNIFPISKKENNQKNSKTTQAFLDSRRSSSILTGQQQPLSPSSQTFIQQVQNMDSEYQIADTGNQREFQQDQDQHNSIEPSDQTGSMSHRSTNPMDEISQLQQLASMHLKKSTKMMFYKSKPNFHLLDQKKIKSTSSLERQQQVSRVKSLKALEQHKGLFPVIHSVNAKQS